MEVQAFERHREWSRREAEALPYYFPRRPVTSGMNLKNRRTELATFCELFAQLRETTGERCGSAREFVDRVRLLVHRLNAIAPGPAIEHTSRSLPKHRVLYRIEAMYNLEVEWFLQSKFR
ncbi:hypothetical protein E8E15_000435 [Penicillium rubens]|nr:hypothetical protein E8E15_000435 [Penicillium rubens]KAJ5253757.1 hypothetical protein N7524_010937 [Penicillium chrysogenum]